jgi:hypothetical protein
LLNTDDQKLLTSFERIYQIFLQEVKNLQEVKSIHVEKIKQLKSEIRSYSRILEDISLPARLIVEHILELKHKSGQVALEAENVSQGFSAINSLAVEEFGVICISIGTIELTWRDEDYNYFLYPDKVELRKKDEKTLVKFFFSQDFGLQHVKKFSKILDCPQLFYIHPELRKYLEK